MRVDAILESLADDHSPFCPTIYCLTISRHTDPTDAMNPERVHMEGNLDFTPGEANEYFSPILRAKDDVLLTTLDNCAILVQFGRRHQTFIEQ